MKKALCYMLGYINSVCVVFMALWLSVSVLAFNLNFYSYEYDKNKTMGIINIEKEQLVNVTKHLLNYMDGKEESLNIQAIVAGEERAFFNEKEIEHMKDVKNLFEKGKNIRNISIFCFLISVILLFFMKTDVLNIIARCNQIFICALTILCVVTVGAVAMDFNKAFTIFHEIFFTNDLWILDPKKDLLINMVPTQFFIDIAVCSLFFIFIWTIAGLSTFYLIRNRR